MSSENSLSFFGAGGHSHNGVNSTLIDTTRYSIFDFSLGFVGSQARINSQSVKQRSFEDYVIRIINSQVLQPAGLSLDPDTLNGKTIRANTITSTEIQAGTITANELTSNIVLVNNIIRSTNFDGIFHANGVISNSGTVGWAISHAGSSVFSNTIVRGVLEAGVNSTIGGWTAGSDSLYKEIGENRIDIFASNAANTAPSMEIFAGDSLSYNQARLLSHSVIFENFENPNTSDGIFGATGVSLSFEGVLLDEDVSRSISLTSSGLDVFLSGTTFTSVSTSGITAVGPIGTLGTLSGARGGFIYTGAEGTIEVRRSKVFSNLASSQRFMTFINTDNNTPVAEIAFNTGGTGATFNNLSDRDYKNILDEQIDGIDIIKKIKPVVFTWKNHESSEKNYGFVAQDLYDIIPHAVSRGGDLDSVTNSSRPWMVSTPEIIPYLVKAIQELSQKIEDFESRLQTLEDV
jgi:hypothetical protein